MRILLVLTMISMGCVIFLATTTDLDQYFAENGQVAEGDADDQAAVNDVSLEGASEKEPGGSWWQRFLGVGRQDTADDDVAFDSSTSGVTLMKFGADWCGPCRRMDAELEKLKSSGLTVHVRKVNVDQDRSLARKYNVGGIPHLVLLEGDRVVAEKVGFMDANKLETWIKSNAPSSKKPPEIKENPFFQS